MREVVFAFGGSNRLTKVDELTVQALVDAAREKFSAELPQNIKLQYHRDDKIVIDIMDTQDEKYLQGLKEKCIQLYIVSVAPEKPTSFATESEARKYAEKQSEQNLESIFKSLPNISEEEAVELKLCIDKKAAEFAKDNREQQDWSDHDDSVKLLYSFMDILISFGGWSKLLNLQLRLKGGGAGELPDLELTCVDFPQHRMVGEVKSLWELTRKRSSSGASRSVPDFERLGSQYGLEDEFGKKKRGSGAAPNGVHQILARSHAHFARYGSPLRSILSDGNNIFFVLSVPQTERLCWSQQMKLNLLSYGSGGAPNWDAVKLLFRHIKDLAMKAKTMRAQAGAITLYNDLPSFHPELVVREPTFADPVEIYDRNGARHSYTLTNVVNSGRTSTVLQGRSETRSSVCLKCEPVDDSVQTRNEATILELLAGTPGVPNLLVHGEGRGYYWVVTDEIGISLSVFPKPALNVLWSAAVAVLELIHLRGITITDLKPDHLILARDGVRLIDYGGAYETTKGRRRDLVFYNSMFSSHSEMENRVSPGTMSDWESLMYSFYFLYCGRLPWTSQDETQTVKDKAEMLARVPFPSKARLSDIVAL